ncbi:MAG: hypothetical protein NTV63_04510 [Candidatus Woesearchaeota archaeon]|nr:hypothetical protein [Candidatus Woesearchaeota archaeon]
MSQSSVYELLEQYKEHALTCKQISQMLGLSKGSVVKSLNVLIHLGEVDIAFQGGINRPVYRWKG